jgi:hypothetical protein
VLEAYHERGLDPDTNSSTPTLASGVRQRPSLGQLALRRLARGLRLRAGRAVAVIRGLTPTLCLTLLSGCTADLRPESLAERTAPVEADRGRQRLLGAAWGLHQAGSGEWLEQPGAEVELLDRYEGLYGFVARPWPENPQRLTLRFRPGDDDGWVEFEVDGEREAWGVVDWNTWRREPGGQAVWAQEKEVAFWVPTLAYFLELPFRVGRDAGIVDDAGPGDYEGQVCDRVYVTWESYEPGDLDQYVVWVRRADARVVRVDFTVRELYDFVAATARYSDYRLVDGYVLPHRIEIGAAPPEDVFHVIEVEAWRVGAPLADSELAPGGAPPPRPKPR